MTPKGEERKDITYYKNPLGMQFVLIPAGAFMMGSEEGGNADERPAHRVRITRPFFLQAHETTVGQFEQFVRATKYRTQAEIGGGAVVWNGARPGVKEKGHDWRSPGYPQAANYPVACVSWDDAQAFCKWLSGNGKGSYRLPTEAEWEYACRAGSETRYYCGDSPSCLHRCANYADASIPIKGADRVRSDGRVYPAPVASYLPNAFGLYDMHGNLLELCSDFRGPGYYASHPEADPQSPSSEEDMRACRGGYWRSSPSQCRSADRHARMRCAHRKDATGFRVVCLLPAPGVPSRAASVPSGPAAGRAPSAPKREKGESEAAAASAVWDRVVAAIRSGKIAQVRVKGILYRVVGVEDGQIVCGIPGGGGRQLRVGLTSLSSKEILRLARLLGIEGVPEPERTPSASAAKPSPAASAPPPTPPKKWTSRRRRVKVMTPKGERWKNVTYCKNTLGMEFVLLPAGVFMMGTPRGETDRTKHEGPLHRVRIRDPFYMQAHEVTQRQWAQVMGSNASYFRGPGRPVERTSWEDAQEFVKSLCAKENVATGVYRLPTEAEWEYACRAGSRTRFYSGQKDSTLGRIAWYESNSNDETHEVGQKLPNAFGLYDMIGNVREWCQDRFDKNPSTRVRRGGSYKDASLHCRSAWRYGRRPVDRWANLGFRVAKTLRGPHH